MFRCDKFPLYCTSFQQEYHEFFKVQKALNCSLSEYGFLFYIFLANFILSSMLGVHQNGEVQL